MKKLITHLNPHLDDSVAMWLFVRLHPDFIDAQLLFKAKGGKSETLTGEDADSNPDIVYVGTGMGKFDEHKGDLDDCAATLVWKYLIKEGFAPKDEIKKGAYQKIVDYTFLEDTAKLETVDNHGFMLAAIANGYLKTSEDSLETTQFTFEMLDALLYNMENDVLAESYYKKKIDFETKWGKGCAFQTTTKSTARLAYKNGYVLTISEHIDKGYKVFGAQSNSDVDFTETYEKLKQLDPEANWYLHQSKRLLICGSDVAENTNLSKLTLSELIELIKK